MRAVRNVAACYSDWLQRPPPGASPIQTVLQPGQELASRYRIERMLGRGGMGAVYLAVDARFDRRVAIKQSFFADNAYGRAFEREARLLNELRHPHLPVVLDYFSEGGTAFLVMDFVDGQELAAIAGKEVGSIDRILGWLDGDLKLAPDGTVKLLDFGHARGQTEGEGRTAGTSLPGYTPHFAPPEQVSGATADPRSDLYSLAATFYCVLSGKVPPDSVNRATALASGQADPLRGLSELAPAVPAGVVDLLHQSLSINPNHRPESAAAMREALERERAKSGVIELADTEIVPPRAVVPVHSAPMPASRGRLSRSLVISVTATVCVIAIIAVVTGGFVVFGWRNGWFRTNSAPPPSAAAPVASPSELEGTWIVRLVSSQGRLRTSVGWVDVEPEKLAELIGLTNGNTVRWQIRIRGDEGTILETRASGNEPLVLKGVWADGTFVVDTSTAGRTGRREISLRDSALIGVCSIKSEKLDIAFTVQGTREMVGTEPETTPDPARSDGRGTR